MPYDFDTPEGRLRAIEALGIEGYNAALEAHIRGSFIAVVNGYGIRSVASRFGRLYAIHNTRKAYSTLESAKAYAASLPRGNAEP